MLIDATTVTTTGNLAALASPEASALTVNDAVGRIVEARWRRLAEGPLCIEGVASEAVRLAREAATESSAKSHG